MSRPLVYRPRRLRQNAAIRSLVTENHMSGSDFVAPVFVVPGEGLRKEIPSMPGVYHHSIDCLAAAIDPLLDVGVQSVLLFGIPMVKDAVGSDTVSDHGIVQQALRTLRSRYPDLCIMTDVCLCEYTDHGHCGVVQDERILNDETLTILAHQAVSHAQAGADFVAPSGMMDGAVGAIRSALDEAGFGQVGIMGYTAKYASAFYGPFRDAVQSAPGFGDRTSYQMNAANRREAMTEARLDVAEGVDILMVKPALSYLDIVADLRREFDLPIAAYNVSGEYSMVMAGARAGWIEGDRAMMEILLSMKRAGADILISYFAERAARFLKEGTR